VRACVSTFGNELAKLAGKVDSKKRQHHWPEPPSLVCSTGRHHCPGHLATCSKHFNNGVDDNDDDDDDDADDDDDDDDDDNNDDDDDDGGDGDD
jgi:hypothetical protein